MKKYIEIPSINNLKSNLLLVKLKSILIILHFIHTFLE